LLFDIVLAVVAIGLITMPKTIQKILERDRYFGAFYRGHQFRFASVATGLALLVVLAILHQPA
jgi:hypothetical protein